MLYRTDIDNAAKEDMKKTLAFLNSTMNDRDRKAYEAGFNHAIAFVCKMLNVKSRKFDKNGKQIN